MERSMENAYTIMVMLMIIPVYLQRILLLMGTVSCIMKKSLRGTGMLAIIYSLVGMAIFYIFSKQEGMPDFNEFLFYTWMFYNAISYFLLFDLVNRGKLRIFLVNKILGRPLPNVSWPPVHSVQLATYRCATWRSQEKAPAQAGVFPFSLSTRGEGRGESNNSLPNTQKTIRSFFLNYIKTYLIEFF